MKKIHLVLVWILCFVLCSAIHASSTIINDIQPGGYTINQPGTYIFKKNLTWNPNSDGIAITIQANDVTLNMKGYELKSSSSILKTTGILATGCERVTILNGKIKNMGFCGIKCNECVDVAIKKMTVDGLYLNETAIYTVPTGILADACIDVTIDKCIVKNIDVQTGSCAAIQLTSTVGSKVSYCRVKNLLNRDGACTGIGHLACDDAVVKSCKLSKIKSEFINNLNTEGHTAIGIVPVATTNLNIQRCIISKVTGCCDDAHGISVFLCLGAIVNKCKVFNVIDGVGAAQKGAKATGIEIYASGVQVTNCVAKDITAINPEDKQATGFSCAECVDVKFINCKAENVKVVDQNGRQSSSLGYGTGFGWAPDPRPEFVVPAVGVLYQKCTAKNCQVGFDTFFHIDCVWDHLVSINNKISILNQPNSQRTLSCDPCSECGCEQVGCYPDPLVVTITNVASNNIFLHTKTKD